VTISDGDADSEAAAAAGDVVAGVEGIPITTPHRTLRVARTVR
jgi:hypothetical protein